MTWSKTIPRGSFIKLGRRYGRRSNFTILYSFYGITMAHFDASQSLEKTHDVWQSNESEVAVEAGRSIKTRGLSADFIGANQPSHDLSGAMHKVKGIPGSESTSNSIPNRTLSDSSDSESMLNSGSVTYSSDTDTDLAQESMEVHLADEDDALFRQADDRMLNPAGYFDKLEAMERKIALNSAIFYWHSTWKRDRNLLDSAKKSCSHSVGVPVTPQKPIDNLNTNLPKHSLAHDVYKDAYELRECRDVMDRVVDNIAAMQDARYSMDNFSLLVLDSKRQHVVRLVHLYFVDVVNLCETFQIACQRYSGNKHIPGSSSSKEVLGHDFSASLQALDERCETMLAGLGLETPTMTSGPMLWRCTAHVLDFALISYAGAHLEAFDEKYLGGRQNQIHIPGHLNPKSLSIASIADVQDTQHSEGVILRRCRLQCLDEFLGHQDVWVFHPEPLSAGSHDDCCLLLSTDIGDLTDVWGPTWKITRSMNNTDILEYSIGNGMIIPWCQPDLAKGCSNRQLVGNEKLCHWVSSRKHCLEDVKSRQGGIMEPRFDGTEKLLIWTVETSLHPKSTCNPIRKGPILYVKEHANLLLKVLCRSNI